MRGGTVGQCGYRPFFRRVVVALAGNVSVYRYRGIRFSFACRGQFASRLSARRGQNAPCAVAPAGRKARPRNLQGGKPCFFRSRIGIFRLHLFFFAHVDGAYLFDFARGGIGRRRQIFAYPLFPQKVVYARRGRKAHCDLRRPYRRVCRSLFARRQIYRIRIIR